MPNRSIYSASAPHELRSEGLADVWLRGGRLGEAQSPYHQYWLQHARGTLPQLCNVILGLADSRQKEPISFLSLALVEYASDFHLDCSSASFQLAPDLGGVMEQIPDSPPQGEAMRGSCTLALVSPPAGKPPALSVSQDVVAGLVQALSLIHI